MAIIIHRSCTLGYLNTAAVPNFSVGVPLMSKLSTSFYQPFEPSKDGIAFAFASEMKRTAS